MQAFNIDMIAAKLQSVSLGRRSDNPVDTATIVDHQSPSVKDEFSGETDGGVVTVELNSDVRLPYPWEQLLDIRTGEIYYKNVTNGAKTTMDPRKFTSSSDYCYTSPICYYTSSEDDCSEEEEEESESEVNSLENKSCNGDQEEEEEKSDQDIIISSSITDDTSCSSGLSYVSSSSSPTSTTLSTGCSSGPTSSNKREVATLVIAGCKSCFMYLMVPKHAEICPRCNGDLLQLGRNGCV